MTTLTTLFRPWAATPAFADYIDLVAFVREGIFLTKTGQVGLLLQFKGLDYESVTRQELDSLTERLEKALKTFDSRYRLYQYFFRSNHPDIPSTLPDDPVVREIISARIDFLREQAGGLYTNHTFLAVLVQIPSTTNSPSGAFRALLDGDAATARNQLARLFSSTATIQFDGQDVDHHIDLLLQQTFQFQHLVADFVSTTLLDTPAAFAVFKRLLNVDPRIRLAPMPDAATEFPAFFLPDQTLQAERTHLMLDDHLVRVFTLKGFPRRTVPNLLEPLQQVQANFHIVSSWRSEPPEATVKSAKSSIAHNDSTKVNAIAAFIQKGAARTDKTKDVFSDQLEAVHVEVTHNARHFGFYSFTVVLYDRDPQALDQATAALFQAAQRAGLVLFQETYGSNIAFLATLPGAYRYEKRAKRISESNHVDLSFFFTLDQGELFNSQLNAEYLAPFTTRNQSLYFFNLHQNEVAHTAIFGPTGSGKSFLVNYLYGQVQKYSPFVTIIDLGASYQHMTHLLGGTYTNISAEDRSFRLNPFSLPPTPDNINFLCTLVASLMERPGDSSFTLTERHKNELFHKIQELYSYPDASTRRLSTFANTLPAELSDRLQRWLDGNQYGYVFDNPSGQDALALARLQAFNFEGFDAAGDVLEPLLFYILHRASSVVDDPSYLEVFKLFVLDEAWTFLRNPRIRDYVLSALKTWRKRNAAVLFATQSVADILKAGIAEDIVSACATRLFLANPSLDPTTYQEMFRLTPDVCAQIQALIPRQQFLLSRDNATKILTLIPSAKERWLYANSVQENARRSRALRRYNNDLHAALDYLVNNPDPDATEQDQIRDALDLTRRVPHSSLHS